MGGDVSKEELENIIWIDQNIENKENKNYSKELESLKLLKHIFKNVEDAIECIKEIKFKEVKIIISGKLYQEFVKSFKNNINEMYCAPKIIVFTMSKESFLHFNEDFNDENNKFYTFGGIATDFEEIKMFLQNKKEPEKTDRYEEPQLTFDYIDSKEKLTLPLFFKALIEKIAKKNINDYNLNLYETYKNINHEAIKLLEKIISKQNIPIEILSKYYARFYTADTPFYRDINKNLRKNKKEKYLTFIKTLYEGIKLKSLKLYNDNEYLYRGCAISKDEIKVILNYLKDKKEGLPGAIVFARSFLSFSKDKEQAKSFYYQYSKENLKNNNLSRVMFRIDKEKNNEYNLSTHCDIEELSFITKEKEVLFLPFSCFEIKEIKEKEENGYHIELSYLGKYLKEIENDKNLYLDEKILPDSDFKNQLFEFGLIKEFKTMKTQELKESFVNYTNIVNKNNFITGQIKIESNDIDKDIQIINSFEKAKKKNEKYPNEMNYQNESDILDYIEIRINDELTESYSHKFQKEGKYTIKYIFKEDLTKINHMFYNCCNLIKLDFSKCTLNNITNMCNMFNGCTKLEELNISNLKTQNVTDMKGMFYNCYCLSKIDLTKFNTEKVTNMNRMFYNCYELKEINLSSFNTKYVTDMGYMFNSCNKLQNLNLTSFDTQKVTDMSYMFNCCSALTNLNLTNFKTDNVINMNSMFYNCSRLSSLDLKEFNTMKGTDMNNIFYGCSLLTKDKIKTKDKRILKQFH